MISDTAESQDALEEKTKLERIETKAQKMYQGAQKWGEHELRIQIIVKQKKVDKWLKKIARELHID